MDCDVQDDDCRTVSPPLLLYDVELAVSKCYGNTPIGKPFPEVTLEANPQAAMPMIVRYDRPSAAPKSPPGPGGNPHPVEALFLSTERHGCNVCSIVSGSGWLDQLR